jgi:hypothetical protein
MADAGRLACDSPRLFSQLRFFLDRKKPFAPFIESGNETRPRPPVGCRRYDGTAAASAWA